MTVKRYVFICDIENTSKADEGATKLTINFIKNIHGEKIILCRSSERSITSNSNIRIIKIPYRNLPIFNIFFIINYIYYIFATCWYLMRIRPDEVYFIPLEYPHPLSQVHACILNSISKNFQEILYQKPKMNLRFKIFNTFRIGVISKDTETYLRNRGFDCFRFPVIRHVPNKKYDKDRLRMKYGFDEKDFIILHVGHADPNRGLDVLLSLSKFVDDKILIVLSSWHNGAKPQFLKDVGTTTNIRILDEYIPDIYELYAIADVYIFPITSTGGAIDLPLSILEAEAMKLPIIASDIENVRNVMKKYSTIYLIKISTQEKMAKEISEAIQEVKEAKING